VNAFCVDHVNGGSFILQKPCVLEPRRFCVDDRNPAYVCTVFTGSHRLRHTPEAGAQNVISRNARIHAPGLRRLLAHCLNQLISRVPALPLRGKKKSLRPFQFMHHLVASSPQKVDKWSTDSNSLPNRPSQRPSATRRRCIARSTARSTSIYLSPMSRSAIGTPLDCTRSNTACAALDPPRALAMRAIAAGAAKAL
jgi:hypothetical protein